MNKTTPPSPIEEALKACPFIQECHADKHVDSTVRVRPFMHSYVVSCGGCASSGPIEKTEAEAIAAWNRRAREKAVEGLVDAAMAAFDKERPGVWYPEFIRILQERVFE